MKLFLFLTLFTVTAHAQYMCEDIPYLKEKLHQLKRDCNTGNENNEVICRSSSGVSSSVAEAIEKCRVRNSYSSGRVSCEKTVSCSGGDVAICHSSSGVSPSVAEAIEKCRVRNSYSSGRVSCEETITCN